MDDIVAEVEAQYCPPLDPALVSAILSDYDLARCAELDSAKRTLDELKEDAILNEAATFDPSGTGADGKSEVVCDQAESRVDTNASQSQETASTSLTNGISSLDLDERLSESDLDSELDEEVSDFDQLDESAKIKRLQSIFGQQVSRYSIQHTLQKYHGKWNAAVDDLLSQATLLDAESSADGHVVVAKGIDGFTEEQLLQRGRKRRTRNKRPRISTERRSSSLPGLHHAAQATEINTWKRATKDVEFIASRTGMSSSKVSSLYYENGASLSDTIAAILKGAVDNRQKNMVNDAMITTQAVEIAHEFSSISQDDLQTLVKVTYPSQEAARELALALVSKPRNPESGGIQIIPRFAALDGLDANSDWGEVTKKAKSATTSRSPSLDLIKSAARREAYAESQAIAFSKASAAHRKAKSDRLMGGAAAYYGQLGREYAALSSKAAAETADRIAASQSTSSELDLHGVDVANAVRIAQEKVEEWWERLGENRINGRVGAEDRLAGYRIIVGLGRHSEGGKSKLGPAVTKLLKQEGWRVESTGAVITVRGPAKR
jgi:hypothetical protein